jgi:hypothetical protein
MIFALSTDDRSLAVFSDADSAIAYCEGIDVAEGVWLFWGPAGQPLEAVFSVPASSGLFMVNNGKYTLAFSSSGEKPGLNESLAGVAALDPNPYFPSLAAIAEHLSQSRPIKHHGA